MPTAPTSNGSGGGAMGFVQAGKLQKNQKDDDT
jgi:hypothetical protein